MWFVNKIFSIFGSNDEKPENEVTVVMKPKQVRFRSLFLLGEEFFTYHENVNTKNFVEWLKKNHETWFSANSDLVKSLFKYNLKELIEAIYDNAQKQDHDGDLAVFLRKWYVQVHGVFSFSVGDRIFVSLYDGGHLLQVLYRVSDDEIIQIDTENDVCEKLTSPEDFRNNWFVGTESSNALAATIASHLIANADLQTAHYKLITNDNVSNQHFIELLKERGISNYVEIPFETVTTTPNDAITIKRFNRYEQFNDFAGHAESIFKQFLKDTPSAKRFDDFFMLSIWDDKNHPKNNVTYVNVAFGCRPLIVSHHNKGFTSTVEEGARLSFYRIETGEVTVTLFPAKTENRKPREEAIVVEECIEPQSLTSSKTLKKYWILLVSYMECTSIDGNPSCRQRKRIARLRYTKHLIINDVYQPSTKRTERWQDIGKFVLTVGLSGFLFYLVQFSYSIIKPDFTQRQYHEEMIRHIDSLHDAVRQTGDTVSIKLQQIQDEQRLNNQRTCPLNEK